MGFAALWGMLQVDDGEGDPWGTDPLAMASLSLSLLITCLREFMAGLVRPVASLGCLS